MNFKFLFLFSNEHQISEAVLKWKKDLDEKVITSDGKPVPAFLLANKVRLFEYFF